MMKIPLIIFFLLISNLAFCQDLSEKEKYQIFSEYLKVYDNMDSTEVISRFVVKKRTSFGAKNEKTTIKDIAEIGKGYLQKDVASSSYIKFYGYFEEVLDKDSLWLSVIEQLGKKINEPFLIKNKFITNVKLTFVSEGKIFRSFKRLKNKEKGWQEFYKKYPQSYALIEFSDVASDGKRAVFYFASRRDWLYGRGQLILFHKENKQWKFLTTIHLWYS